METNAQAMESDAKSGWVTLLAAAVGRASAEGTYDDKGRKMYYPVTETTKDTH